MTMTMTIIIISSSMFVIVCITTTIVSLISSSITTISIANTNTRASRVESVQEPDSFDRTQSTLHPLAGIP